MGSLPKRRPPSNPAEAWADAGIQVATVFSGICKDLNCIRTEIPPHRAGAYGVSLVRNLSIAYSEALDYMRQTMSAVRTRPEGGEIQLPRYYVGRYREILDISNPFRPFNPHLLDDRSRTKDILAFRDRLADTTDTADREQIENDLANVRREQIALCAERTFPHESIAMLERMAEFADEWHERDSVGRAATLRDKLMAKHRDLVDRYVKNAERFLPVMPNGTSPGDPKGVLMAMQHPVLFLEFVVRNTKSIARRLDEGKPPFASKEEEVACYSSCENLWNLLHGVHKNAWWVQTVLSYSKEEIDDLAKTVEEFRNLMPERIIGSEVIAPVCHGAADAFRLNIESIRANWSTYDRLKPAIAKGGSILVATSVAYAATLSLPLLVGVGAADKLVHSLGAHTKKMFGGMIKESVKHISEEWVQQAGEAISDEIDESSKGLLQNVLSFCNLRMWRTSRQLKELTNNALTANGAYADSFKNLGTAFREQIDRDSLALIKIAVGRLRGSDPKNFEAMLPRLQKVLEISAAVEGAQQVVRKLSHGREIAAAGEDAGYTEVTVRAAGCEVLAAGREIDEMKQGANAEIASWKAKGIPGASFLGDNPSKEDRLKVMSAMTGEQILANARHNLPYVLLQLSLEDINNHADFNARHPFLTLQNQFLTFLKDDVRKMVSQEDDMLRSFMPGVMENVTIGKRMKCGLMPRYSTSQSLVDCAFPRMRSSRECKEIANEIISFARDQETIGVVKEQLGKRLKAVDTIEVAPVRSIVVEHAPHR